MRSCPGAAGLADSRHARFAAMTLIPNPPRTAPKTWNVRPDRPKIQYPPRSAVHIRRPLAKRPNRRVGFEQQPRMMNRAWVGDITYIATAEGWLYLAVIMDLASRRI